MAINVKDYLKFDPKLFVILFFTFIVMTVVGTLIHELGHYSAARLLGYEAHINYGSTGTHHPEWSDYLRDTHKKYRHEIQTDKDFPGKEKFLAINEAYRSDHFWIILGGPLQTILTGTLALLLLYRLRKRLIQGDTITFWGWLLVFFSLFWLREVANFFNYTFYFLRHGTVSLRGDETKLALDLGIHVWSIQLATALIGLAVLGYIVFKILPKKVVFTFLLSGLFGGVAGYYLWLIKYGPLIFP